MMRIALISILLFLVVPVGGVALSEPDYQENPTRRMEGIWVCRFPKTILGEGIDRIIELKYEQDLWTISFTTIGYFSMNLRQEPQKSVRGPFQAQIKDGVLVFVENGKEYELTVRMEGENLVMPAFVQVDEKSWVIKNINREGATITTVFQCESDYTKVPVGRADFPGVKWDGVQRFYSYERGAFDPKRQTHRKYLRFLERMPDGAMVENCRLIWDEHGSPRFDGSSWYRDYEEHRYFRLIGEGN